jgi:hypothetical protein
MSFVSHSHNKYGDVEAYYLAAIIKQATAYQVQLSIKREVMLKVDWVKPKV